MLDIFLIPFNFQKTHRKIMNDIKLKELEERISNLENWLKLLSNYWSGAESPQELIDNIKQSQDFKKINDL